MDKAVKVMRESHDEQIVRWAHFVRDNPTAWKEPHTLFIDALFAKHAAFLQRLKNSPGGKEKLQQLYGRR